MDYQFSLWSNSGGGISRCTRTPFGSVEAFAKALDAAGLRKAAWNPWWSPHVWSGDTRRQTLWEGACAVVFDLDWEPDGKHCAVPEDVRARVLKEPPDVGNLWHMTPCGMRIVFVLDDMCWDRDLYCSAADGACEMVRLMLEARPWMSGFVNDVAVYKDLARIVFTPKGIVKGAMRDDSVHVVSAYTHSVPSLIGSKPMPAAQTASVIPVSVPRNAFGNASPSIRSSDFQAALDRYNREHARDWGRSGTQRCPFHQDGGKACFGAHPGDPSKWCCWSTNHPDYAGHLSSDRRMYVGDAADVDAWLAGKSVYEFIMGRTPSESVMSDSEAMFAIGEWGESISGVHGPERVPFLKRVGETAAAVDFAERTLARNGVYSRDGAYAVRVIDGRMVRISMDEAPTICSRYIRWNIPAPTKDDPEAVKPWDPTPTFARQVLGQSEFTFLRPIEYISTVPVLREDGSFVTSAGYDRQSAVFFWPSREWGELPKTTSREEALRCVEVLKDIVADFPFKSPADLSAWMAALLSPVCRRLYRGCTPMFVFTATTPGSGKTKLATVISRICQGRGFDVVQRPADASEEQKAMLAMLLGGRMMCLYDNERGEFRSSVLEAVLTSGGGYTGRVLGSSKEVTVPVRTIFYLTGNNLVICGDLTRRVVTCSLEPDVEHPECRTGFRHPDLDGYVCEHQTEIYVAAARIAQAWVQAGRPHPEGGSRFGSFEGWTSTVRDMLLWLGFEDCVRDDRLDSDESEGAASLMAGLDMMFGGEKFTLFDMCRRVESMSDDYVRQDVLNVWEALVMLGLTKRGRDGNDVPDPVKVSSLFRSFQGRIVSGRRLENCGRGHANKTMWRVVAA